MDRDGDGRTRMAARKRLLEGRVASHVFGLYASSTRSMSKAARARVRSMVLDALVGELVADLGADMTADCPTAPRKRP